MEILVARSKQIFHVLRNTLTYKQRVSYHIFLKFKKSVREEKHDRIEDDAKVRKQS